MVAHTQNHYLHSRNKPHQLIQLITGRKEISKKIENSANRPFPDLSRDTVLEEAFMSSLLMLFIPKILSALTVRQTYHPI
ncbi:hypothetical protein Mapa_012440 [Marchantia paleacea]|nr:hypothetical protein Mapa_012440 [Marchantia paleacea]